MSARNPKKCALLLAPCRLEDWKNRHAPFPGRMSKRRLNQAQSVLSLSIGFLSVLLFIRANFCVPLVCVCMCSVSSLFWLSYQYLPNDWLERLLRGSLFVIWRLSPQSPDRRQLMTFLVQCIVSLFYCLFVLSPGPTWYISYSYSYRLFVLSAIKQQTTNHVHFCLVVSAVKELDFNLGLTPTVTCTSHWWHLEGRPAKIGPVHLPCVS